MGSFAGSLLRKGRGIVGLGVIGGSLGLIGGGFWGLGTAVLELGFFVDAGYWSIVLQRIVGAATYFALPAAFATTSFGVLLGVTDGRRSLTDLPLWRMALLGAVGGGLFVPAYILVRVGLSAFAPFPTTILPLMGLFAGLGGALSVSLTAVAKRAHRAELRLVEEAQLLATPE